jgi:hypothetical protein
MPRAISRPFGPLDDAPPAPVAGAPEGGALLVAGALTDGDDDGLADELADGDGLADGDADALADALADEEADAAGHPEDPGVIQVEYVPDENTVT